MVKKNIASLNGTLSRFLLPGIRIVGNVYIESRVNGTFYLVTNFKIGPIRLAQSRSEWPEFLINRSHT